MVGAMRRVKGSHLGEISLVESSRGLPMVPPLERDFRLRGVGLTGLRVAV